MKFITHIPRSNLRVVCVPSTVTMIDRKPVRQPGVAVQFVDGVYLTENAAEIKLLKANPSFGRDFIEVPLPGPAEKAKPVKKTKPAKKKK